MQDKRKINGEDVQCAHKPAHASPSAPAAGVAQYAAGKLSEFETRRRSRRVSFAVSMMRVAVAVLGTLEMHLAQKTS